MTDVTQNTPSEPPEQDDDFSAAEIALGLAEGEDLTQSRARMMRDRSFALRVAGWQERFVAMTDAIDPVAPHKRVKRAVLAELFPKVRVPLSQRLWVWKGLTLASVCLLAYLTIPQLRPENPAVPNTVYATQMASETSPMQVLAVMDPARGDIALRRLAGEAPAGRVLELWAILPDTAPISLGVLPEGEAVRVALPETLRAQAASITLAITDEPQGGAPDGNPTGTVLAAGAVTEI